MSGIEAIGLVLGVLPLLVSVIEHYDDVFRPFRRFKEYAPEFARFERRLLAQKTIFRSQCQLLLHPLTDLNTAETMLNEKLHLLWTSKELDTELSHSLGRSAGACIATMKDIEEQLTEVQRKADELNLAAIKELPTASILDRAWRARLQKRLKLSISEASIDRSISQLRELNQDFSTLSNQTTSLLAVNKSENRTSLSTPIIKHCGHIQQASVCLYEALQDACSTHTEHQAHLRVDGDTSDEPFRLPDPLAIQFCVGLSRWHDGPISNSGPSWFVVKTVFRSATKQSQVKQVVNSVSTESGALKRSSSPTGILTRIQGKRLKGNDAKPRRCLNNGDIIFSCPNVLNTSTFGPNSKPCVDEGRTPDFCVARDLCLYVSKFRSGVASDSKTCFGHLRKSSAIHELYLDNRKPRPGPPISLTKLLKSMSERSRTDRVPLLECVNLARRLALVVLQFQSTPMLKPSWTGEDIAFLEIPGERSQKLAINSDLTSEERLPDPYLKTKVESSQELAEPHTDNPSVDGGPIRNHYLFRLGVVMLELAYQAPLRSLSIQSDRNSSTDFEIADKYSRLVGSMLGPRYARIVRKCIGCDFGKDVDLSSQDLSLAVHQDVVVGLDNLVKDFKKTRL